MNKSSHFVEEFAGMTPLHLACSSLVFPQTRLVKVLLNHKADGYAIQNCTGNNVLHMIAG